MQGHLYSVVFTNPSDRLTLSVYRTDRVSDACRESNTAVLFKEDICRTNHHFRVGMSRQWSRRTLLASAPAAALPLLSGCSGPPFSSSQSSSPTVKVQLANYDSERYMLEVAMVRTDGNDLSNATEAAGEFGLEPAGGREEPYQLPEALSVENRPYIVRAVVAEREATQAHYHYIPDCELSEGQDDRIRIIVRSPDGQSLPAIKFGQDRCYE